MFQFSCLIAPILTMGYHIEFTASGLTIFALRLHAQQEFLFRVFRLQTSLRFVSCIDNVMTTMRKFACPADLLAVADALR